MLKMDKMFILVAAALCQTGAGALLLFLHPESNYFAFLFPSMILSTLGMDWVRNVGAVSRLTSIQSLPSFNLPFSLGSHQYEGILAWKGGIYSNSVEALPAFSPLTIFLRLHLGHRGH